MNYKDLKLKKKKSCYIKLKFKFEDLRRLSCRKAVYQIVFDSDKN